MISYIFLNAVNLEAHTLIHKLAYFSKLNKYSTIKLQQKENSGYTVGCTGGSANSERTDSVRANL